MPTRRFDAPGDPALSDLHGDLAERDLQPLWELSGLLTPTPRARAVPYRWRGKELRELGGRAGDLVPVDRGGNRRVLSLSNPELGGGPYASAPLWGALQYLGPREAAPAHRHTPAALRFVLEGEGVWTMVNGDPLRMAAGDLVLTPSWTWHEHHSPGDAPMTWFDALDLPLVEALEAVFFEPGPEPAAQSADPARSASERRFGAGPGLLPGKRPTRPTAHSPLLRHRWADTDRALASQFTVPDAETSATGHAHVRFADPTSGRDVMPTMRCEMHRYMPGHSAPALRCTGSSLTAVFHGAGFVVLDGTRYDIAPGDLIAVPSWTSVTVVAEESLDLFTVSDAPVLEALSLYREEAATDSVEITPAR
ncbi:cupin domain-containing protein [Streptomyces yaanensis]|uniref:Cupin domain-containing protein n=1 Tax=Streptomyces yaanensis TaxID=1142239 RepID=A0ABV7SKG9_9ACTN|nr:cupin domain-containing protein [Streptomyces sp. CGMCC 4.7035]WNC00382.1 cupin domain-containing protein [Streptomyces sp. CGMCC 4.7035]